ncbi:MAG: hypothetical protein H0U79_04330 [Solirubrobacterales bacterium]|nr:hypothetical protein [Solirubrobacterales bacterium]
MATRLPALEKVERDARVAADRACGLSWRTISARHGLGERQCREVVRAHRASGPALDEHDPVEVVQEALEQLESLVERLALVAETSRHDAVRLGALKARLAPSAQRLSLLQAVGILPRSLGLLRDDIDLRRMGEAISAIFDRHGVPFKAEENFLAALESERVWRGGSAREIHNGGG